MENNGNGSALNDLKADPTTQLPTVHFGGWACFQRGVGLEYLHPEVAPSLHDSMI